MDNAQSEIIVTLEGALRARKVEDRLRAVQQLIRLDPDGNPEVQRLLMLALQDRNNYVAAQAANRLADGVEAHLLKELVTQFLWRSEEGVKRDPGCHVRAALAYVFGRQEVHAATDALHIGIRTVQMEPVGGVPTDTAVHLRANCALALAHLRSPDALRDISLLLFDRGKPRPHDLYALGFATVEARKAAAQALGDLGDPAGIVPLAIKLRYPDDEVSEVLQECMQAVVDLEDERLLEVLELYLHHEDPSLAAFACLMLARAHHPEALERILSTVPSLYGNPLEAALLALTTLRGPEAEAALKALKNHERPDIRDWAKRQDPSLRTPSA